MGGSQPQPLSAAKRSIMKVNPQKHGASRKHRAVLSCTSCRKRKVKCDRLTPCTQCVRLNIGNTCTYPPAPRTPSSVPESSPARSVRSRPAEDAPNTDSTPCPSNTRPVSASSTLGGELPGHDPDHGTSHGPVFSTTQTCPNEAKHPEHSISTDSFVQFVAPLSFRGKQKRTRFFGRSHWATTLGMFPDLNSHLHAYYQDKQNPTNTDFAEYLSLKRLKHDMKGPDRLRPCDHQNQHSSRMKELLPDRSFAEYLMQLYFSTFEYTLRILHVPSFLDEWNAFWNHMETQPDRPCSSDIFLAKLLVVMACSACFATRGKLASVGLNEQSFMQMCHEWIEAVTTWLGAMAGHTQLNLDLIQIKCLLVLAKQGTAWEGDLASLAAGSLIREAILMGFHRDPSNFSHLSPYWAEMRKRLWLTIVELELQASLYNGVPLAISWDEFDCPPPSNIEDEDLTINSAHLPSPKPPTTATRMTFLIALSQTLQTRMEVSRTINRVRLTAPYKEVMAMSESLSKRLADAPHELRSISTDGPPAGPDGSCPEFQRSFFLFLNYRCLLALHRPFFLRPAETRDEPFVFSRRACVQISLALLAQLEYTPRSNPNDQLVNNDTACPHILQLKGGMFRDDIFHAAITVCYELRLQAKDKVIDPFPGTISVYIDQSAHYQRMALFESVERAIKYFELKVYNEKRATKVFNILTMLFTSIKSQILAAEPSHSLDGQSDGTVLTIDDACPAASRRCRELLLADKPLNHSGVDLGDVNLNQDTMAQDHDGTLVQQGMQPVPPGNNQDINPGNLDLEWYFSLDPLSPYPINSWPELDPLMV